MITEGTQLGNLYIKVLNHSDKDGTFEPDSVQEDCKTGTHDGVANVISCH
jgi:hypothetical protein